MENENAAPVEAVSEPSPIDVNTLEIDWEEDSDEIATPEPADSAETPADSEPDDFALAEGQEEAEGQDEQAKAEPLLASDEMVVEVDGEKVAVKDLKEGRLLQADYTRSKQALAQERGQLQELGQNFSSALERIGDYLYSKLPPEPDAQLAFTNPNLHYQQKVLHEAALAEMMQVMQVREGATKAVGMLNESEFKALMSGENETLVKHMPHLKDQKRLDAFNRTVAEGAKAFGFTDAEINSTADHRIRLMAYEAAYGRKARADAAKAKAKVQEAKPMLPVQRSKSVASDQDSKVAAAQKRFDANPSPDNAAMLIALTS